MVCVLAGVVRRCFSTSTAWEGEGLPGRPDRGGATVWEDDTDDEIVFEKRRGDTKVVEKGPTKQLLNDKPKLQMSHEERKSLNAMKDLLEWEEEKVLEVIRVQKSPGGSSRQALLFFVVNQILVTPFSSQVLLTHFV